MQKLNSYSVAVGGATGNVGQTMLAILEERRFPVSQITRLASITSVQRGCQIGYAGKSIAVQELGQFDFGETDILFLSTGGDNSRLISPRAAAAGCIVIDNSSAFRMHQDTPLLVPEVNPHVLTHLDWKKHGIFPVANCSTIQLVLALKPLHAIRKIKRIVIATYQSSSGGGKRLMQGLERESNLQNHTLIDLQTQASNATLRHEDKPIAFNVVPHIDIFMEDGRTKEEWKLEVETRKILEDENIQVSATCVRVPVFVGHAQAVNVEFDGPLSANEARELLSQAPGIIVLDEARLGGYSTPLDSHGKDAVFVSRIREDKSIKHGLSLWIVADNIRKGAALNAVQIAETLIEAELISPKQSLN